MHYEYITKIAYQAKSCKQRNFLLVPHERHFRYFCSKIVNIKGISQRTILYTIPELELSKIIISSVRRINKLIREKNRTDLCKYPDAWTLVDKIWFFLFNKEGNMPDDNERHA